MIRVYTSKHNYTAIDDILSYTDDKKTHGSNVVMANESVLFWKYFNTYVNFLNE